MIIALILAIIRFEVIAIIFLFFNKNKVKKSKLTIDF